MTFIVMSITRTPASGPLISHRRGRGCVRRGRRADGRPFAADADGAGIRISREILDHFAGPGEFGVVGGEGGVDIGDLAGVDRHFSGKTGATGSVAFGAQAGIVAEVDIDGVDRIDAGGLAGEDAEGAREPKRIVVAPVGQAVDGAEQGGEVFGAPGQRFEPWGDAAVVAEFEDAGCGFGGNREDAGCATRDVVGDFEGREIIVETAEIGGGGFRQQDAVGAAGHHSGEILEGILAGERIDADHQALGAVGGGAEEIAGEAAGERALAGADGIFEIEDEGVGATAAAFFHFPFAVGGNEEHRAHF